MGEEPVTSAEVDAAVARSPRRAAARLLGRVVVWFLVVALVWFLVRFLRRLDWAAVGDAVGHLAWWQALVLLVLTVARTLLAAAPLGLLVDGLGTRRAAANDLTGNLVATVTPAPADIVARAALFRAWGVDVSAGMAGLVLNSILYYVVRLAVPVVGALLLLALGREGAVGWPALVSGLASVTIVVVLVLGSRSEEGAYAVGRRLGSLAHRVRPSWPGPDELGARVRALYVTIAQRWRTGWWRSLLALGAMVLVETAMLVLALRFVGVTSAQAPLVVVAAAFFSTYLLMATPFLGLGVLDAAVVAIVADRTGAAPAGLVAGLVVWRVAVQLVPLAAGTVPLLSLRRRARRDAADLAPADLAPTDLAPADLAPAAPGTWEPGADRRTRAAEGDAPEE